jgi:hypothetical protein
MKSKAISTLTYTGIVTLSQYIGSKKIKIAQIHNTGGNPLFRFLADCLAGDSALAAMDRPTKIMLVKRNKYKQVDGTILYDYERKSGFIPLLTQPEKVYSDTESTVKYSFMIPRAMLEEIDSFEGLGIGLYPNGALDVKADLPNYAAFCEIAATKSALINAILVVDWELHISNRASV